MMHLKIPNYPREFIDAYVKFMLCKYINKIDKIDIRGKKSNNNLFAKVLSDYEPKLKSTFGYGHITLIKCLIKEYYLQENYYKEISSIQNIVSLENFIRKKYGTVNEKLTEKINKREFKDYKGEDWYKEFIKKMDEVIKKSNNIISLVEIIGNGEFRTFFEYFKELILMKPEDMEKYVCQNKNNNNNNPEDWKCVKSLYNLSEEINIAGKLEKINTFIVRNFIDSGGKGLLVCPYCNRNYVNNRGKVLSSEMDHFYNKNKYPMFAISLYNFIPSCSSCNRIKGIKELKINPFLRDDTNKIKFDITIDVDGYKIDFIHDLDGDAEGKNNIEELKKDVIDILRLDEVYKIHDIEIKEMVERERKFDSEYREYLKKIFPEEGSELEKKIDVLIYGDVVFTPDEELVNKSLGKFKKDVYEKIKKWKKQEI